MYIVFLGPPGVGKGTQCQRISDHYLLPHVSTGDMMRAAIGDGGALGERIRSFVDAGQLVPGEIVIEAVRERMGRADIAKGCLLDGFPRTVMQAEALDKMLAAQDRSVSAAIQLKADQDELKRRLLTRQQQLGRTDDTPETIAHRLDIYAAATAPLVEYYGQRGQLSEIDGIGTQDEVFGRIRSILDALPSA